MPRWPRFATWCNGGLEELQSLVVSGKDYGGYQTECGQWVKIVPEIRLTCGWVWTSERDPVAPTARIFNFNNVYHYTVRISQNRAYRALPVRDLE